MENKPNNDSSVFSNLFGIPKEWEEISVMFTSLLQKEIIDNIKSSPNFSSPEKIFLYSEEWKKAWKEIEKKAREASMKNFPSSYFSMSKEQDFNKDWEEFWKKMMKETQRILNKSIKKFDYQETPSFSAENIVKTIRESLENSVEKMERLEGLRKNYSHDFQDILQSSTNNFQEEITKAFSMPTSFNKFPKDMMWLEMPIFSSIQQLCLLNFKFLRESVKI